MSYDKDSETLLIPSTDSTPEIISSVVNLQKDLKKIVSLPFFSGGLPSHWGVILDTAWDKSSGYFSDSLKTPEGNPAILFAPKALLDGTQSTALVAHELTHLMHHGLRPHEESWVREGIALLAEWRVTGRYNRALSEAFAYPETSLIAPLDPRHEEFKAMGKRLAQYGHLLQYFSYIYRLCGKDELLDRLLTSPSKNSGLAFMDEILRTSESTSPACKGFDESFKAFSIARVVQNPSRPETFIILSGLQTVVRQKHERLPPFSSSVYRLDDGESCLKGEIPWGATRCIRIRLQ